MTNGIEALAKFMFERQAATYTEIRHQWDIAWADEEVRKFWMDESEAIHEFLSQYKEVSEPPC